MVFKICIFDLDTCVYAIFLFRHLRRLEVEVFHCQPAPARCNPTSTEERVRGFACRSSWNGFLGMQETLATDFRCARDDNLLYRVVNRAESYWQLCSFHKSRGRKSRDFAPAGPWPFNPCSIAAHRLPKDCPHMQTYSYFNDDFQQSQVPIDTWPLRLEFRIWLFRLMTVRNLIPLSARISNIC